jgi:hypothetical protein
MVLIAFWLAPLVFYLFARSIAKSSSSRTLWTAYWGALFGITALWVVVIEWQRSSLTANVAGIVLWAILWQGLPLAIAAYTANRFVSASRPDCWKVVGLLALAEITSGLCLLPAMYFGWFWVGHGYE